MSNESQTNVNLNLNLTLTFLWGSTETYLADLKKGFAVQSVTNLPKPPVTIAAMEEAYIPVNYDQKGFAM